MNLNKLQSINIHSKAGTKVVFSGRNGLDQELERAKDFLITGREYIVEEIVVDSWRSDVYLQGFPVGFNSVFFVTPESWSEANS